MISNIDYNCIIGDDANGYIAEDAIITDENQFVKLYIPSLMPDISHESPKKTVVKTDGRNVFANAKTCKPAVSTNTLKEQNYLSGRPYISEDPIELKKGEWVRCSFIDTKISKLYF